MAERERGGIVLVGAMGATDGVPFMANAAATKAFVQSLGIGLHHELAEHGVRTTVVIPGPTDTPVIDHFGIDRASLPMQPMSVEQCVDEGLQALKAGRATHLTGWVNRVLLRLLPTALTRRLNARMLSAGLVNGKPRLDHILSSAS
jgi:short-subunit dehydrogenase